MRLDWGSGGHYQSLIQSFKHTNSKMLSLKVVLLLALATTKHVIDIHTHPLKCGWSLGTLGGPWSLILLLSQRQSLLAHQRTWQLFIHHHVVCEPSFHFIYRENKSRGRKGGQLCVLWAKHNQTRLIPSIVNLTLANSSSSLSSFNWVLLCSGFFFCQ